MIIFSFGTLIRFEVLPKHYPTVLVETFKQLEGYNVIWKHDNPEDMANVTVKNIFFKKWIPQKELLGKIIILLLI